MYIINVLYSVFFMLSLFVFIIPYIVYGIMNFRYKVITVILISTFSLIGIFSIKYIEPICSIVVFPFILSPFIINNFKDNEVKDFKKGDE